MKIKKLVMGSNEKALLAHSLLADKKAQEPVILDLRGLTLISDFFVICHGTSPAHIRGLTDFLLEELEKRGLRRCGLEGYQDSEWVLADYGDVVVHIFSAEGRDFYSLERLWGDAPRLTNEGAAPKAPARSSLKRTRDG